MSLLGIDIGTTGCKAVVFSPDGRRLSSSYSEYHIAHPGSGCAELDSASVWSNVCRTIREAASQCPRGDPITALSIASMGEAVVPVSVDRRILGPSLLNIDARGNSYLPQLRERISDLELYRINGNSWGAQYSVTKLMWMKKHDTALYASTAKFLHWAGFAAFMMGCEPFVDYSLANRSLLFDINRLDWSDELLAVSGIDREKLPPCVAPGTEVGTVGRGIAGELGLPEGARIVSGAHDQCANSLGCGAISEGTGMFGMGTFSTIAPTYTERKDARAMVRFGLNTEHHAIPGHFITFIFHMGGAAVKWYRDTLASAEAAAARAGGLDAYPPLFAELPAGPASVFVLPHFAPMGPSDFRDDSSGVILGLGLKTSRADILKGVLEANLFALKESVEVLPFLGIPLRTLRAVGGGSRSDAAVQLSADILGIPHERPDVTEAGALGAALLAGKAEGVYSSYAEAAETAVRLTGRFEPDQDAAAAYRERYARYKDYKEKLLALTRDWESYKAGTRGDAGPEG